MPDPVIDILMTTYNGEQYVGAQIDSILAQSHTAWRLLISDDCSSDDTKAILEQYAMSDERIVLLGDHSRFGSAKENFSYLLQNCEAQYVMFCDQDDVWLPNKIELTLAAMRVEEERARNVVPILVFTDMNVVDADLNLVHESFEEYSHIDPSRTAFRQVLAQSVGAGCTMMANRMLVGEYLSNLPAMDQLIMHDWWMSLIASAFGSIVYIDEPTSLYRQHDSNSVGALKYDPLERVSHFQSMKHSVALTVEQAEAYRALYSEVLSTEQLCGLGHFIKSGNESGLLAVCDLCKSRAWKRGLRKLGQLVVAFMGVNK